MTLTEFLLARIAEDEATASLQRERLGPPTNATIIGVWLNSRWHPTCDPARVLAECEVKRRIVSMSTWIGNRVRIPTDRPGVYDVVNTVVITEDVEPVLRLLALPYADNEDYREEWKP